MLCKNCKKILKEEKDLIGEDDTIPKEENEIEEHNEVVN